MLIGTISWDCNKCRLTLVATSLMCLLFIFFYFCDGFSLCFWCLYWAFQLKLSSHLSLLSTRHYRCTTLHPPYKDSSNGALKLMQNSFCLITVAINLSQQQPDSRRMTNSKHNFWEARWIVRLFLKFCSYNKSRFTILRSSWNVG